MKRADREFGDCIAGREQHRRGHEQENRGRLVFGWPLMGFGHRVRAFRPGFSSRAIVILRLLGGAVDQVSRNAEIYLDRQSIGLAHGVDLRELRVERAPVVALGAMGAQAPRCPGKAR